MRTTACYLSALTLSMAPALALQDAALPGPAQELRALAPLVGSWDGAGSVRMTADEGGAMKWTATIDTEWILAGHALREVTVVEFGAAIPPISMDTLYAFDREAGRLASYGASSMGGLEVPELVHSPEAGTVVTVSTMLTEGHATIDRTILRVRGDALSLVIERTTDGAPAYHHVEGSFRRRAGGARALAASAPSADALTDKLAPLAPLVGEYDLTGAWTPAPGAPAMQLTGVDTMTPVLGGHCLVTESRGTAEGSDFAYEGRSLIAWNEDLGAFRQAWVDNLGMCGHNLLYQVGDGHFVSVRTGQENGVPYTDRAEIRCVDGVLAATRADRMTGAAPVATMFAAQYTPKH